MSKKSSGKSKNKLSHCIKAPFRVLARARDLYVNCLGGCAGRVQRGRVMGYPAGIVSAMPRSQSHGFYKSGATTSDDEIRDLIRAASRGNPGTLNSAARAKDGSPVPRSQSVGLGVGIGRIDEDEPCYFDGDVKVGIDMVCPRSRSCAVVEKRRVGRAGV